MLVTCMCSSFLKCCTDYSTWQPWLLINGADAAWIYFCWYLSFLPSHNVPENSMFLLDIYASIHPNPRIPVNITHSAWTGYTVMMFLFGFVWGCINLLVFWGYFCSKFAFGSGRQSIFTMFIVAPIAVVLILGPFFSPWIALPPAQKVSDHLYFMTSM